jgi:ATP-dependent Lon protease
MVSEALLEDQDFVEIGDLPEEISILPINDAVVYPYMMVPLVLSDKNLIKLADETLAGHKILGAFTQRRSEGENPGPSDIFHVGTAVLIQRMLRFPDGSMRLLGQGLARVRIKEMVQETPYMRARIQKLEEPTVDSEEVKALMRNAANTFLKIVDSSEQLPDELKIVISNIEDPGRLADLIATNLALEVTVKQEILETIDPAERLKKLSKILLGELEVLELGQKLQSDVRKEMDKDQREYYLRQQMKAIQRELGEEDERAVEMEELREKIAAANLPEHALEAARKELDRLQRMPPAAAEYTVARTYIDWIVELPWSKDTRGKLNIQQAQKILDADHYGLREVKERILEYLSVRKLKKKMKGPILCLVGPPGVGKTSLGRSIARATGRNFVRNSLGGMRDEAEIRGHRRTYVGALPGRVLQGMRTAGSNNPVFMLDEIDKLGHDFRGDPSSALLEVLDPEQNNTFEDHYLGLPFDLSNVMFIATANLRELIPRPLLDRMEVLELPGYITPEKVHIAKRFLIPRQMEENGLQRRNLRLSDAALYMIIERYTREAGVRNLERSIGTVCRKVARQVATRRRRKTHSVSIKNLEKFLGPPRFTSEVALRKPAVGVATGMAKTYGGGEILFVEALKMPGSGGLRLTGQIGDVMRESAEAALSFVKANYLDQCSEGDRFFKKYDLHMHVPSGAVPKDGPSAGVAMATCLASVLCDVAVRNDLAMTGEITLTGRVLEVGGVKEKVIAAHRAGIKQVILPKPNSRDLEGIPEATVKDLNLTFVDRAKDAVEKALIRGEKK